MVGLIEYYSDKIFNNIAELFYQFGQNEFIKLYSLNKKMRSVLKYVIQKKQIRIILNYRYLEIFTKNELLNNLFFEIFGIPKLNIFTRNLFYKYVQNNCDNVISLTIPYDKHIIDISTNFIDTITKFKNLEFLSLDYRNSVFSKNDVLICIQKLKKLKGLQLLSYNDYMQDEINVFKNDDLIKFSSLSKLDLTGYFAISDVSFLSNIIDLTLDGCYNLTHIPILTNVKKLKLKNCIMLSDISSLSHLEELEIENSHNITDINNLGNLKKLVINSCYGIKDFSSLYQVRELVLINLNNIKSVNMFSGVKKLHLKNCQCIKDISGLEKINSLYLINLNNLIDISLSCNLDNLGIFYCNKINILKLNSLKVKVKNILLDYSYFENINDLSFENISKVLLNDENPITLQFH